MKLFELQQADLVLQLKLFDLLQMYLHVARQQFLDAIQDREILVVHHQHVYHHKRHILQQQTKRQFKLNQLLQFQVLKQ